MPASKFMAAAALVLSGFAAVLSGAALLVSAGLLDRSASPSGGFEEQARSYLLDNPEVLIEALRTFEQLEQAAAAGELKVLIGQRRDETFDDPASPVLGNPAGDVTLVEFFDYNCPYCRKAAPLMAEVQASDQNVRLVYKEFPILGPGSAFAARAALASQKQGKYVEFHEALMAHSGAIDESATLDIARRIGLDVAQLQEEMQDSAIEEAIQRNLALAGDLRINGTPSFIVGEEIVRGLTDLPTLQALIAEARAPAGG
jgi:protein-disulfide isomerase